MSQDRRERVLELGAALPGAEIRDEQHITFTVRGRTFAYYLDDHHGDGIVGLCCKAATGEQQALLAEHPQRFYRPAYLGSRGWVSLRLDLAEVDWDEVRELIIESYRQVAPKRLVAQLGAV